MSKPGTLLEMPALPLYPAPLLPLDPAAMGGELPVEAAAQAGAAAPVEISGGAASLDNGMFTLGESANSTSVGADGISYVSVEGVAIAAAGMGGAASVESEMADGGAPIDPADIPVSIGNVSMVGEAFTTADVDYTPDIVSLEQLAEWEADAQPVLQGLGSDGPVTVTISAKPSIDLAAVQSEAEATGGVGISSTAFPSNDEFNFLLYGLHNTGQTISGSVGTVDSDIDGVEAWNFTTGSGVVVAVIDSGVDLNHQDLVNNLWVNTGEIAGDGIDNDNNGFVDDVHGFDFHNNDGNPDDDNFHGTHVAGTIAAERGNNVGIAGVAPDAQIMAIKSLGADGNGSFQAIIDGLIYAVDNGADVVNMSLGALGADIPQMQAAIDYALANDVVVISAAGNNANDNDVLGFFPANHTGAHTISVANTNNQDQLNASSNFGATTVDIAGPGTRIASAVPDADDLGTFYAFLDGTSMAAPHVAGIAALLRAYDPTLSATDVVDLILASGDPVAALDGVVATGDRANAFEALKLAAADDNPNDDFGNDETTLGALTAGNPIQGELELPGDEDWFALNLASNFVYALELSGASSGDGTLSDPLVRLANSAGETIGFDDDSGTGFNSSLLFTVDEAGSFFGVASAALGQFGTYEIILVEVDDFASDIDTTGTIDVDGTQAAALQVDGDSDGFVIEMEAGRTYEISVSGAGGGGGTLADAVVQLFDDTGTAVATDDNSGTGNDALLTFTATEDEPRLILVSSAGNTGTGTYTLSVTAQNRAPVAGAASFGVSFETGFNDTLVPFASDADGDGLTFSLVADASNGAATVNADGTFGYTPDAEFSGTDSFTYRVSDGDLTATATVTLTVSGSDNAAPVANAGSFNTDEDVALLDSLASLASDADGDALTFALVGDPDDGTVLIDTDGSFTYTPDANFNGTDTFQYSVSDGQVTVNATVTVTVASVEDAPIAQDDSFSTDEDVNFADTVASNDSDGDGDALTYQLISGTQRGTVVLASDGSFTYTTDEGFSGTESFVYRVSDGALTDTATATITVNAVNDAPVAANDDFTIDEDTPLNGSVAGNDGDPDDDPLTYTVVSNVSNGSLTLNADGSFSYTPDADFNGADSFTYRVSDGVLTDTATVSITINPVNDTPVAVADPLNGTEDVALNGDVSTNDSDADGDALSFSLISDVSDGTLSFNADGTFSYTGDANFNGTDSFTYRVSDGDLTDTTTVTLNIAAVNDAPVAVADSLTTNEDVALNGNVLGNDSDVDGDALTASLVSDVSNGVLSLNADGSFTYTPTANFNGTDSFTYRVSDGDLTDTATVSLTITAVNDAPVAQDDSFTGDTNEAIAGSVAGNDSDVEGSQLTYALVTDVQSGSLTFNADGSFSHTPSQGFSGTETFTYRLSDGDLTDTATVTLNYVAENDPPVAQNDSFSGDEDAAITGNVLANDSDIDGDDLTVTLLGDASNGDLTLNGDGSFSYTGDANFNGTDSFTYQVSDGNGGTDTASVSLTVNAVNDAPLAVADSFSGDEDTEITGSVAPNDSDVEGNALTFALVTDAVNGDLTLNADGSFSYTGDANFNGTDSFTYRVSDGDLTDTATVSLTVNAVNDAPVATADSFSVDEDTELSASVAGNDSDVDGDTLTFTLVTDANNGSLSLNTDGSFTYTGDQDFNGTDSFTYRVFDGDLTDTATVSLTINAVNDAPVAQDDSFSVDEDTQLSGSVASNDGDVDGDNLTFTLVSDASNGSLNLNTDGTFTYTGDQDFNGSDSFTYRVSDGDLSDTATVSLTINSVNDAPVAVADSASGDEDTEITGDVLANDSDADGDAVTVSLVSDVSNGDLTLNANGSFSYTGDANFNGTDSFTYRVSDGDLTNTATVSLTINAVNDAPVAQDDSFSVDEDTQLSGSVASNDSDADGDNLTFTLVSDASNGDLALNADGSFTYTGDQDFNGIDSFTYRVSDGDLTDTATVNLTVNAVNDAPVATADSFSVDEDTQLSGSVASNDSDVDGDSLTFTLVTDASNGSLSLNADGSFTYTGDANFNGSDSFTYRVSDGVLTDTATVSLTINSVNDNPVAQNDTITGDEDGVLTGNLLTNDSDADGDDLSFTLLSDISNGNAVIDFDTGEITYTPDANFSGTDSFTYRLSDGNGGTDTGTVTFVVNPLPDAPILNDDSFTFDEDTTLNSSVAVNDFEVDGQSLTFAVETGPSNGQLFFNANGTFTYVPFLNFNGTDSFTYSASDGELTETATVTLTINAVNDAPVAVADSVSGDEDTEITGNVSTNDGDVDGDALTFTLVTDVTDGDLTLNADGSFSYTGDQDFNGSDSFVYRVSDGALTDTATVSLTVNAVNDAPVAQADSASGDEDAQITGNVSTNDSDVDGDALTYTVVSDTANGDLTLNADGSFTYTGDQDFNGTDSFTYRVSDGVLTDTATVSLSIAAVNDAPVAQDDSFSVDEDTELSASVAGNDSDVDGDNLTFTLISDAANGSLTLNADGSFTYTGDQDFNGTDSFTYRVSDGDLTDTATVSLTVTPVNDAPVAQDDSFSTDEDTRLIGDVSGNDGDAEDQQLVYQLDSGPVSGTLDFNADGTFTYDPAANFTGTLTFTYTVEDAQGAQDSATVTITVGGVNDAPVAQDDAASGDEDTAVTGNVLTNDSDAEGTELVLTLVTDVANGDVTLNADGSFTYTGDQDFNGTDSFVYRVSDGELTDTATVSLTINAVNDAPVAQNDSASGDEDTQITGDVSTNDSDVDGDNLTFTLVSDVSDGSLTLNTDGSFTYTGDQDFNGTDSFTYRVSDGDLTDTATVSLSIAAVNDAPVAQGDSLELIEDLEFVDSLAGNVSDADGDALTFSLVTDAANGTLVLNANGSFSYTGDQDFNGTDSFTYRVSDGELTDTATVSLTIEAVNDTPVAQDDSFSVDEDTELSGSVAGNDSDVDGDDLSFSLLSDVSNGTLTLNADGSFTYTGDQDFNGTDSFTYRISDIDAAQDTATVTITVNAVNDAPVAQGDSLELIEDLEFVDSLAGNVSDADGDSLTFSLVTDAANGTLVLNANGSFSYTGDQDFNGTDSFVYRVSDGELTDTATVSLTIEAVNDTPVAQDNSFSTDEDTELSGSVAGNDGDVDGDDLSFSLVSDVSNGSLTLNADGSFTYTGDQDFNGTDSFTYRVTDVDSAQDTATVSITVNAVNDAPEAQGDSFELFEDFEFLDTLAGNASDVDGDALTFSLVTDAANGTLVLNTDGSFSYTGDQDFNGTDSFVYRVSDGDLTDTATVSLTIEALNDTPVAQDDSFSVDEDTQLSGSVAGNDSDVDGDDLSFSLLSDVANGTLTLNADGSFTYTGDQDFNGTDSFTYRVSDIHAAQDTATVTITVNAVNDAPVAQDDSFNVDEDTELSGSVASNDSDVDGDSLTYSLVGDASNGSLTFNADGSFTYTGDQDFFGSDSFTYSVSDGNLTDTATVSLTVEAVNDLPVAQDDSFSTDEDTELSGSVAGNDSDVEDQQLVYQLDSPVASGNLDFNADGTFTYDPAANFTGTVSFTYTVEDAQGEQDSATVTITVDAVNDAPVAQDDSFSVDEDTELSGSVASNDSDVDGDSLTYSLVGDVSNGSLTFNADGSFTYTGDQDFFGSDSFTYSVSDGNLTDTATVSLTVEAVNDLPVAQDDSFSTDEDTQLTGDVSGNDTDAEDQQLIYQLDSGPASGTLDFKADGSFTYDPAADFTGTVTFTYTVEDAQGEQDSATVAITVDPVNDAPVAQDDAASGDEDTAITGNVLDNDSDVEGDQLSVTLVSDVANGSLTLNADGSFSYTGDANFNGSDSFTYRVSDGDLTDTATASLTIDPVNDAPDAVNDSFTIAEETELAGTVATNDSDLETITGLLVFELVSDASNGTLTLNTDGSFTYTGDQDFNGADSFVYRVTDTGGATDTATVSLTVTPVNDAPVAQDDSFTTEEDAALNGSVAGNDSDIDGDALSFSLLSDVSNGSLTLNADGSFTYTPGADFNGTDSFTYRVSDGDLTDTATVSLTVTAQNDAPTGQDDAYSGDEDGGAITGNVLDNDSDPEGAELSVTLGQGPANGNLTLNADGSFSYTPAANFNGTDSFTYTVSDGQKTDTATVTLTVNAVNDAPVAVNDSFAGNEDTTIAGNVGSNDSDVDGDNLTYGLIGDVSDGSLIFNADGSFSYTGDANFSGTDSFSYRLSDGVMTDTATVSLTINAVNDAPVAQDDSFGVDEDTQLSGSVASNDGDVDGDSLTFTLVSDASNGDLTLNADGSFTYSGDPDFNGQDSFTYRVSDGDLTDTATVSLTINAVNDAPIAIADSASGDEDTEITGNVLANDSDADDDALTVSLISDVSNGDLALNADGSFSYTGDADFNGTDSFTYRVSDGVLTDTATVSLTINAVNDAPVAQDDAASGDEDTGITGDVSTNDSDVDGDGLTFSLVSDVSDGNLTFNADGSFSYTGDADFSGTDSFVYRVTDGDLTDTATVTLTVSAVNDAPGAVADAFGGDEDAAITGNVLDNDGDVDGDELTVTLVSDVSDGTLTLNADGSFSYTGDAEFSGADSFVYRVSDGVLTDTATVTIDVASVNDAPGANDDQYSGDEDTRITGNVLDNDSDIEGDNLSVSLLSNPASGALTLNADGSFTFDPAADFNGPLTFSYTLSDGDKTDIGVVTLSINPVDDAPAAQNDQVQVTEDQAVSGSVAGNDSDADGDQLTYTLLIGPENGEIDFDADGSFDYSPDANYNGPDSFTYRVSDGALTDTATVSISVAAVNDAPKAVADQFAGTEDQALQGNVLGNDSDIDGDNLSVSLVSGVSDGELTLNANGSFSYTGDANFNGQDSFTYRLSDGDLTDTATVTLTLTAVNDAPVAVTDQFSGDEDSTLQGDVLANDSDVDGDNLTVTLVSGVSDGSLNLNANGSFTYTGDANFNGQDSFTYRVSDGVLTDTATVTLVIGAENDAPVAVADQFGGTEDQTVQGNVLGNDSDIDGDSLTVSLVSGVSDGALTLNANGSFTYTGDANFNGTDSFVYRVSDGNLTDTATVTLSIAAVNDAPVAANDQFGGTEDQTLQGNVLANDSDVDGDSLTVSLVSGVSDGSLTLNANGSFTYTGDADFNGVDSFTYRVSDGGLTDTATVTLVISPVNDAPVAGNEAFELEEDENLSGQLVDSVSDVDGDGLSFQLVSDVSDGALSLNTNGSFSYTPDADFNGADSFTYRVSDGNLTDTGTISLTVNPVNDAPDAQDDSATTDFDTAVSGNVLANDTDVDGDSLNASLDSGPSNGSVTLGANGSFTYTPDQGFSGTDSFTYVASDGDFSDTATVTITVEDAPEDPENDAQGQTPGTAGVAETDVPLTDRINFRGDRDWFAIQVFAGATYIIDLSGADSGEGDLPNPLLRLLSTDGDTLIAGNNNGGPGLDARLAFTSNITATLNLEVSEASGDEVGSYRLEVAGTDYQGTNGRDVYEAGARDDRIDGERGRDDLSGGAGADDINGGNGSDTLNGEDGNDDLSGQNGNDILNGGDGDDVLKGGRGRDRLNGDDGDDDLRGNNGNDTLVAGTGDDVLNGGNGNDLLRGNGGDDVLEGVRGRDFLEGGSGSDILVGGTDRDILEGGAGDDIFRYNSLSHSGKSKGDRDRILDFDRSEGDKIDLSGINGSDEFELVNAFSGEEGEMIFNQSNRRLQIDLDGDGKQDWQIELPNFGGSLIDDDFIL